MPDEPEVRGLLALMLLHHARRDARVDAAGDLVTARASGSFALGSRGDRGRARRAGTRRASGATRSVPGARRDRRVSRGGTEPRATRTGRASWRSTTSCSCSCRPRWLRSIVRWPWRWRQDPTRHCRSSTSWSSRAPSRRIGIFPRPAADLLRRLGRDEDAAVAYRAALALTTAPAERRYLQGRLDAVTSAG